MLAADIGDLVERIGDDFLIYTDAAGVYDRAQALKLGRELEALGVEVRLGLRVTQIERGAAMLEPYSDDPSNTGLITTPPERVRQVARMLLHRASLRLPW